MTHYSAICVGGPLDGRRFDHDYHQFQFPDEPPMKSTDYAPGERADTLRTVTVGLYTYSNEDCKWHWKL
jgi:hypothetical protein